MLRKGLIFTNFIVIFYCKKKNRTSLKVSFDCEKSSEIEFHVPIFAHWMTRFFFHSYFISLYLLTDLALPLIN